jgi:hypothetical protein
LDPIHITYAIKNKYVPMLNYIINIYNHINNDPTGLSAIDTLNVYNYHIDNNHVLEAIATNDIKVISTVINFYSVANIFINRYDRIKSRVTLDLNTIVGHVDNQIKNILNVALLSTINITNFINDHKLNSQLILEPVIGYNFRYRFIMCTPPQHAISKIKYLIALFGTINNNELPDSPYKSLIDMTQRVVAPTQRDVAPTQRDVAPTQRDVAPTQRDVALTQRVVALTQRVVAPTKSIVDKKVINDELSSTIFTMEEQKLIDEYREIVNNVKREITKINAPYQTNLLIHFPSVLADIIYEYVTLNDFPFAKW